MPIESTAPYSAEHISSGFTNDSVCCMPLYCPLKPQAKPNITNARICFSISDRRNISNKICASLWAARRGAVGHVLVIGDCDFSIILESEKRTCWARPLGSYGGSPHSHLGLRHCFNTASVSITVIMEFVVEGRGLDELDFKLSYTKAPVRKTCAYGFPGINSFGTSTLVPLSDEVCL